MVGVNPEDGNLEWKSIATEYFHDVSFSPLISFSDFALSVIVHKFHFSKDVASKIGKFGKFSFQKQNYQLDPALTYLIYYHGVLVAYIGGLKQLLHNDRVEVVCHCFLEINLSQLSKLQSKLTFHQDEMHMHMHNSNLITRHLNYYSCKKGDYQKVKSIIKKVSPTCKIQIQDRYLLPIRSKEVPEKY